eukprot:6680483-Prymnesium_polylepis.1
MTILFAGGCAVTFLGVFCVAWGKGKASGAASKPRAPRQRLHDSRWARAGGAFTCCPCFARAHRVKLRLATPPGMADARAPPLLTLSSLTARASPQPTRRTRPPSAA